MKYVSYVKNFHSEEVGESKGNLSPGSSLSKQLRDARTELRDGLV